jgi:hypothetical protein
VRHHGSGGMLYPLSYRRLIRPHLMLEWGGRTFFSTTFFHSSHLLMRRCGRWRRRHTGCSPFRPQYANRVLASRSRPRRDPDRRPVLAPPSPEIFVEAEAMERKARRTALIGVLSFSPGSAEAGSLRGSLRKRYPSLMMTSASRARVGGHVGMVQFGERTVRRLPFFGVEVPCIARRAGVRRFFSSASFMRYPPTVSSRERR